MNYAMTTLFKQPYGNLGIKRHVFYQQDSQLRAVNHLLLLLCYRFCRQRDAKTAALTDITTDTNTTLHRLDQRPRYRQTYTRTHDTQATAIVRLIVHIENTLLFSRSNTDAGICYRESKLVRATVKFTMQRHAT